MRGGMFTRGSRRGRTTVVLLASALVLVALAGVVRPGDGDLLERAQGQGAARLQPEEPGTTTSSTSSTSTTASVTESTAIAPTTTLPLRLPPPPTAPPGTAPGGTGVVLTVGPGQQFTRLQDALDVVQPGEIVRLATAGAHDGPAVTHRDGTGGLPITISAVAGARLVCPGGQHRCLEIAHSWYRVDGMSIEGGSSNLYVVGAPPVHDVKILNSTFRGRSGTGECIRVKYHAANIEIARNNIADCGLGKCCESSKNGEGVYIGTAPEQLDENPSPEPDRTHGVWVHHNVMRPLNECVDVKEAAYGNVIEQNDCGNQQDPESGAFGSRGGRVGEGNVFRGNVIENARGACVRFGGDAEPDGTGNTFTGNVCRNIQGEYGVKQMREPQGPVCGNRFEGSLPVDGLSRTEGVDPTAPC